jgi:hypothetical protein
MQSSWRVDSTTVKHLGEYITRLAVWFVGILLLRPHTLLHDTHSTHLYQLHQRVSEGVAYQCLFQSVFHVDPRMLLLGQLHDKALDLNRTKMMQWEKN